MIDQSNRRGILMEKVIASIVIIVLTLGLISYAVIGQMSGFRTHPTL